MDGVARDNTTAAKINPAATLLAAPYAKLMQKSVYRSGSAVIISTGKSVSQETHISAYIYPV